MGLQFVRKSSNAHVHQYCLLVVERIDLAFITPQKWDRVWSYRMERSVKTTYPENNLPSARKKARVSAKLSPWLFLAPAILIFVVYVIYPILDSIWLSFYEWDGLGEKTWVGLDNYRELFDSDAFYTSLKNNFLWLVFFMLAPPLGLAIALFLNQQVRGIRVVKSLFSSSLLLSRKWLLVWCSLGFMTHRLVYLTSH